MSSPYRELNDTEPPAPSNEANQSSPGKWKKIGIIVAVLVVLAIAGIIAAVLLTKASDSAVPSNTSSGQTPTATTTPTPSPAVTSSSNTSSVPSTKAPTSKSDDDETPTITTLAPTTTAPTTTAPSTGVPSTTVAGTIKGGSNIQLDELTSEDGQKGNPKSYNSMNCSLPNYESKNGMIYATFSNGTSIPISIKGVNWFGMETDVKIPLGLWENGQNGTTVYQIAKFLAQNNFNSVRLPLSIESILNNDIPNSNLINQAQNRAISISNYMNLLKDIIKALGYRKISVLLSLHTLSSNDRSGLWYNSKISESQYLNAVDILSNSLCSNDFWNVIGIDVKNEPYQATWGDGKSTDFRKGAILISNRMLNTCPKWLAFIEGVCASHTLNIDDKSILYYDWWGGGLQKAKDFPIELNISHKVVWAPHYYTPAVYPQDYFYGDNFSELSDNDLKKRIQISFDHMFGYLIMNGINSETSALVLGEFGGLYKKDLHPMKTIQRTVDYTIDLLKRKGFSGGYMWSLNPESGYEYNPGNIKAIFNEGLLEDSWTSVNENYLNSINGLNTIPNLQPFPCGL